MWQTFNKTISKNTLHRQYRGLQDCFCRTEAKPSEKYGRHVTEAGRRVQIQLYSKKQTMESEPLVEDIQQTGVLITVVKVTKLHPVEQSIYVEVRTDDGQGDRISYESTREKKTKLIKPGQYTWNDSFHYNTTELVDDNLTFILKHEDGTEIGRHNARNIKFWQREQITEKVIQLTYGEHDKVADLHLKIQYKENQDLISGIWVPDLSLCPREPFSSRYNAIDGYNPNAKTNRANCFSFYDGDQIPGFDEIDIYPPKFKLPKDLQ